MQALESLVLAGTESEPATFEQYFRLRGAEGLAAIFGGIQFDAFNAKSTCRVLVAYLQALDKELHGGQAAHFIEGLTKILYGLQSSSAALAAVQAASGYSLLVEGLSGLLSLFRNDLSHFPYVVFRFLLRLSD